MDGRTIPWQLFRNKPLKEDENHPQLELQSKPTKESFPLLSELDVISHHTLVSSTIGRDDTDNELFYQLDVRRALESRDEPENLEHDKRNDAFTEDLNARFTHSPTASSASSQSRRDPREERLPPPKQRPLSVQAKHTIALVL